jgi:penicillin-binding protein 2
VASPRSSQFIRRLIALAALGGLVFLALGAQLVRLTVVQHEEHRTLAEGRLDRTRFLPTARGRILDRHGRVLAADRPSFDLALEWEFISGSWIGRRATKAARAEVAEASGRSAWRELSRATRDELIASHLPKAERDAEMLLDACARAGEISREELDQRLEEIRRRVHQRAVVVWDRQLSIERARFEDAEERFTPHPIQEHREAHVILQSVPDVIAFELTRLGDEWPGVLQVQESTERVLPLRALEIDVDRTHLPRGLRSSKPIRVQVEGVADHIIGSLRERVFPSDVARRPFLDPATGKLLDLGGYRPGLDRVGASGIEAAQEGRLRGTRGVLRTRLDTGAQERLEPVPGRDVALTIDIELQAIIHAMLDPKVGLMKAQPWQSQGNEEGADRSRPKRDELAGAVVVLDVDSGEILAAVSTPTVAAGLEMTAQERALCAPFINRPFEAPYPPGSILKPFIYLGAVGRGALPVDLRVPCDGHYVKEDPTRLRCWIYRERTGFATHSSIGDGPLGAQEAVKRSCNIFFYTAAHRLGSAGMLEWMRELGVGAPLDTGLLWERHEDSGRIELVGEHGGFLPSADSDLETSALIQMGIGQGPLAWTPVQAANALATLARGGVARDATLLRGPREHARRAPARGDLRIDPRSLDLALAGMRDVASSVDGTAHHITYEDGSREPIIDLDGLVVWAKTGTVQTDTPPDHAWFAGLVGSAAEQRPRFAVAVIVEHGRSGGRGAGPVFNSVLHALRRCGHLPALAERGTP